LQIARENAEINKVKIRFLLQDIRNFEKFEPETEKWDIIVSNPPYVCQSEKAEMENYVLMHEPHLALFVNNDDPLLFYRIISQYATKELKKNGGLYFEINSHFGEDTRLLVQKYPFGNVELFQDLSGRDRMIKAIL